MAHTPRITSSLTYVITAIFTALVAVSTLLFQVYIPATRGYFNIGESIIYVTALLFGPFVGAFAGGVGSMIADLASGYYQYAPWTLVNKGFEGFLAGYLFQKLLKYKEHWSMITLSMSLIVFAPLSYIGMTYFTGFAQIGDGFNLVGVTIDIPPWFWIGIGGISVIIIVALGHKVDPNTGIEVLSMFIAGLWMVFGYFIYEQFVLNLPAVVEVPFNILQCIIGIVIAVPVIKILRLQFGQEFFGQLESTE
ncbi:MAG: ECF transporter S component [Candidatus Odinarchaeota archaeon]|nr:ECF transporter S component [Candidatus Odinarchaeota archaeon]